MHMRITHHPFAADKDLTLSFHIAAAVRAPLENLLLPSEEAGFCYQCSSTAVQKEAEGHSGKWPSGGSCFVVEVLGITNTLTQWFQISSSPLVGFMSTQLRCLDFTEQDGGSSGWLQSHQCLNGPLGKLSIHCERTAKATQNLGMSRASIQDGIHPLHNL